MPPPPVWAVLAVKVESSTWGVLPTGQKIPAPRSAVLAWKSQWVIAAPAVEAQRMPAPSPGVSLARNEQPVTVVAAESRMYRPAPERAAKLARKVQFTKEAPAQSLPAPCPADQLTSNVQ